MTTTATRQSSEPAATAPDLGRLLVARSLPTWAPALGVAVGIAVSLVVAFLRGSDHAVPFVVVAFFVGAAVVAVWSFQVESYRRAVDRTATTLVYAAFGLAMVALGAVLVLVVYNGVARLDAEFFTNTLRSITPRDETGGYLHAIVATLEQVALATAFAVPLGIAVAVYLVEFGGGRRFANITSYVVDVMTGLPSIVAGLFILALWILTLGQGFSGLAGAMALSVLMLPIVIRSSEEMLKLVPDELREASYALGVPRWKTVTAIVIPTALPGMITGIMLAVARIFGETAPILLVVFGANSMNYNPFDGAQSSLPLSIYQDALSPNDTAIDRAWTGALVLIIIVLILNLSARFAARKVGSARG